ncbi:MAG: hypothetical protein ACLP50_34085 [Solirubrobacteraceae bacterium]
MRRRPISTIIAVAVVSLLTAGCGGGSSTTPVTTTQNGLVSYSHCMRSHGVPNFPDPTSSAGIPKSEVIPLVNGPQLNVASNACAHLAPNGLGPQDTTQHTPAHTAAMLAFARCVRSHGFPSFPDPTSSGQLTPEMAAQAGINLHHPAVLQTAEACASVTHGILTKATVARALNQSNAAGQ